MKSPGGDCREVNSCNGAMGSSRAEEQHTKDTWRVAHVVGNLGEWHHVAHENGRSYRMLVPSSEFSIEQKLLTVQWGGNIAGNFMLELGSSRLTLRQWAVSPVTYWKAEQSTGQ